MKRLITIAFLGICTIVSGQSVKKTNAADQVKIRCYYLFSKKKAGAEKPYRSDTMILDIGSKMSRFYDPARLGRDSLLAAKIKNMGEEVKRIYVLKGDDAKDLSNMPGTISSNASEGESYQIYKETAATRLKVADNISAKDQFQYEDEIGKLPWKILKETETILSYNCQKATVHFRGRDYIAWFTADVPVSDGPWKFMGLPGLILKVEDTAQLFSFTLIGLNQPEHPITIPADDSKRIKCTREELEKLKKKEGSGLQFNFTAGDATLSQIPGKFDYLPMELE